jgi:hypothetical protein
LKEARDREDALFKDVKHFVEQSLEGVKLTAPQSQGTPISSQAQVLSSDLLSQPPPPIAESPDYPSTLSLGCDSVEIFRALIISTSNVDTGNSKLNAFLLELVEDSFLFLNSLLACDVLLRQLDQSSAQGADGFSQFSSSIAWNRLLERQPGVDLLQLAKTLTRAYIQKQGDRAGIDMNTVWNVPHMKHDINECFYQVLGNDLQISARGLYNAMKYKELLCEADTRAQCVGTRPFESSCIYICQFFLAPYESSRKDLYKNG